MIHRIKEYLEKLGSSNKQILSNIFGSFLIKGGAMLLSLFTLPAYMRYFDNQLILGFWFTALSVLSWILTFDLGIGNGLRNNLVTALVDRDKDKVKRYISSAYLVMFLIVCISYGVSYFIFPIIDFNLIFNVPKDILSADVLLKVSQIIFIGIMIQFLLRLVISIFYALQKAVVPNLLTLISTIIQLMYVLFAHSSTVEQNLINFAYVNILAVNLPLLIATVFIFTGSLKGCAPNIKFFTKQLAYDVMKLGGVFFWIQVMYMILTATNDIMISWFAGPDKVVEYQVYNRLFTLIGTFFSLALTPIWSAVTKAFSEEKYSWIVKLYRILKKTAVLAVVLEILLIPFLQALVNLWLGKNTIEINFTYAFIFAIFGSLMIWNSVLSSIANGMGILKTQLLFFTVGAIIKLPIVYVLNYFFNSWIVVIVANILVLIPFCIVQPVTINNYLKEKTRIEFSKNKELY